MTYEELSIKEIKQLKQLFNTDKIPNSRLT